MQKNRAAARSQVFHGFLNGFARRFEIASIHPHSSQSLETIRVVVSVHRSHFGSARRNTPFVVLHQKENGQVFEYRHLEGLGDFAFGHGPIAQGTNDQRRGGPCRVLRVDTLAFEVGQGVGHAHGRDGLHAGGRALVRDRGHPCPTNRRMRIIGASPAKRVVGLGQQLQHQLVGLKAHPEQNRLVAVIDRRIVLRLKVQAQGQLYGLVAPGCGVHITGFAAVLIVQFRHGSGRVHEFPSRQPQGVLHHASKNTPRAPWPCDNTAGRP